MNAKRLEIALKKQRLLERSAALREELGGHVSGLVPLLSAADRVRAGANWLGAHPYLVGLAATGLAFAKPRITWRWTRRLFLAWHLWRRLNGFLHERVFALSSLFSFFSR